MPGVVPMSTTVATGDVNWVTYTVDAGVNNYIPTELIHALVACGRTFALYGVNSPTWLTDKLKVDFTDIPGVVGNV